MLKTIVAYLLLLVHIYIVTTINIFSECFGEGRSGSRTSILLVLFQKIMNDPHSNLSVKASPRYILQKDDIGES